MLDPNLYESYNAMMEHEYELYQTKPTKSARVCPICSCLAVGPHFINKSLAPALRPWSKYHGEPL